MNKTSTTGVGMIPRTYAEIWKAFAAKHGDTTETREIHLKWKKIGSRA